MTRKRKFLAAGTCAWYALLFHNFYFMSLSLMRDVFGARCFLVRVIACAVFANLLDGQLGFAQDTRNPTTSRDDKFAGLTAWQVDEKLGKKWQEITGRFIFQRSCLSCHQQGPESFSKTEWEKKLEDFPDEGHVAILPEEFKDLTAMFSYGRMVANDQARYQALETFLLKHAPDKKDAAREESLEDAGELLPTVGQRAPDFSIVDTDGKRHTPKSYTRNGEALILVFSRAHW